MRLLASLRPGHDPQVFRFLAMPLKSRCGTQEDIGMVHRKLKRETKITGHLEENRVDVGRRGKDRLCICTSGSRQPMGLHRTEGHRDGAWEGQSEGEMDPVFTC